jgi:hypothetical protein
MLLAVAIPILMQVTFPEKVSPMVINVFDAVENLPEGSSVLMAYDYDPASAGELHPMATAFTRHCAFKKHKMYFMTLWPAGLPMVQQNLDILNREYPEYEYGTDYVNLGYKTGLEGVIKLATTNLREIYSSDNQGTNLDNIPMTADLKDISKMDLIINVSAGTPGAKEWVQYASTPFKIPTVVGTTGVGAPALYPYIPNQLVGLLGAIKGAAEYEKYLIGQYPELAENPSAQEGLRRMAPQMTAHVLMIFLIVLGNIIFFQQKRKGV